MTCDEVRMTGVAVNHWNPKNLPHEKVRLHQQIEVKAVSPVFAVEGDSGSLVFLVSEING